MVFQESTRLIYNTDKTLARELYSPRKQFDKKLCECKNKNSLECRVSFTVLPFWFSAGNSGFLDGSPVFRQMENSPAGHFEFS